MKRMGRPKKDDSKTKRVEIRMTELEFDKLSYLSDVTGQSKTEIIQEALSEFFKRSLRRKM